MQRLFLATLAVLAGLLKGGSSISEWGYEGDVGPSFWPNLFPSCKGTRQSPINIERGNIKREYWEPLVFVHYDEKPSAMRIKNNGHSAQIEIDASSAPRVKGGGLPGEYIFTQFHFHWGENNHLGSEHTIDGIRYPLEMHLVHYKAAYGDITSAIQKSDGLLVMGVLFEVGPNDNPNYDHVISALDSIKETDRVASVDPRFGLAALLPKDSQSFYRYEGSLTTPTCNEVALWNVFSKTVLISKKQLMAFRSLNSSHGSKIVNNFRSPQPLFGRRVYERYAGSGSESATMKQLGLAMYFMSTMAVLMMNM